jgi:glycosyltransferase involved in cell wall biosynthesis
MKRPNILLLSAYDASSHRYWRELLVDQLPEFDWTTVALPDRHFYWRVRSNALTVALQHRETLAAHYDLVLATSMTDLCGLRGLVPSLSAVPTVLYFHENQFAYPVRQPSSNIINSQLVSFYAALSADRVLFNSHYNRQSFLSGANALFNKMPDGVPDDVVDPVDSKSAVLPVPIVTKASSEATPKSADRAVQIVWNHRWEYDKQPEVFFNAMSLLQSRGVNFVLHVLGQSFRTIPECFADAKTTFGNSIATWGYQPRDTYLRILREADIVVSSAAHDFQGLGILEAISQGCVPVTPDRVAYVEYVPEALRYCGDDNEPEALCEKLLTLCQGELPAAPDVSDYYAENLINRYREEITSTIAKGSAASCVAG